MKLFLPILLLFACFSAHSQAYFQAISESSILLEEGADRKLIPDRYSVYELEIEDLSEFLARIPMEFTPEAKSGRYQIQVPQVDGSVETYNVWKVMNCEQGVYDLFPEIRTFAGQSVSNPLKTIRGSITQRGCRIMTLHPNADIDYLEPYAWGQTRYYMIYNRADFPSSLRPNLPGTWEPKDDLDLPRMRTAWDEQAKELASNRGANDPVELRTFRFAVSCTGEFAQDHGGTKELAFAAVVEYTNQFNAINERDVNTRMQLIPSSLIAMFTDPNTDPFFGTTVQDWMDQNVQVLSQTVTDAAFDIGHCFARYLGGSAIGVAGGLGCQGNKAAGCTAGLIPYGDPFVNVVGQEVGHQLTAGHTWNRCGSAGGREGIVAYSPGSGSTIMSYAGSCGSDNVQGFSDQYYHSGSVNQIRNYILFGATCPGAIPTDNHDPIVTVPYEDNFFIPIMTPFELDGTAEDVDGDELVYAWEEIDLGPETPLQTPVSNSPIFRVWPATTSSNRYFPRLNTILNNNFDVTEQLPTYSRDLSFRLVAKDDVPGAGGVGWDEVYFRATEDAGPFVVMSPNSSSDVWEVGTFVNVTWDVANTNQLPVDCQHVNIRLSTDGGQTYPIMLAENVINDGSQLILVPDNTTSQARVRVDAADNVFFDLSNSNFTIQQPSAPALSIGLSADGGRVCLPGDFETDISTIGLLGYSGDIEFSTQSNLPAGAEINLEKTTIAVGETNSLHIDLTNVAVNGIYSMTLIASSNGETYEFPITFELVRSDFSAMALTMPEDGTTDFSKSDVVVLRWNTASDAMAYDVQYGSSPDFDPASLIATLTGTELDTFRVPTPVAVNSIYYWRVRPVNVCGPHDWLDPFTFASENLDCNNFTANDLPKFISANGMPSIQSTVTLNGSATVNDINVKRIDGYHEFLKDLSVSLISPQGTEVVLFSEQCGNFNGTFKIGFDDEAPSNFLCPPGVVGNYYIPEDPLSNFDGQDQLGPWTLKVSDNEFSSGGALTHFELEFCSVPDVNNPFLVNNEILYVNEGSNGMIPQDLLLSDDIDNTSDELVYTLITKPKFGRLEKNWGGEMEIGETFTQADVNNGAIRYFNYGFTSEGDYFRFTVTDGTGGFLGTPRFVMESSSPVSTQELDKEQFVRVQPNPASNRVIVFVDQPLQDEAIVSLFDLNGKLVFSEKWQAGKQSRELDLNMIPSGLYLVQLRSASNIRVTKLVVE